MDITDNQSQDALLGITTATTITQAATQNEADIINSEHVYSSSEHGGDERTHGQFSEVGSESGVEPDYTEWVFDENSTEDEAMFDLTNEQALATLKYFSSTANRTNIMTKTHGSDLDLISQLLLDKEKDLDLAAKIGQSLLQRNKSLLLKIEKMEEYLSETKNNEMQLKHDLQHKNELARLYFEEDEKRSYSSDGSRECEDSEIISLTNRCRTLEKENQNLFSEALNLRQMTNDIEEKEEGLVLDCIEQLASAKQQITALTDEIAQKFEDNVQQQEEITQLIDMVVDLQKKQKQLSTDNEDLQMQLLEAHNDKDNLRVQLETMQMKFQETYEMLQENQEEMKSLRDRMEFPADWLSESGTTISLQDSLANEIEETVKRDLISSRERKKQNKKVLENVRFLNVRASGSVTSSTSGRTSPSSNWSLASDERSETLSTVSTVDFEGNRPKKNIKKLQIVKPMEGSDTLNKWHHLASQNVTGGLNVSDSSKENEISVDDDRSTVINEEKVSTPNAPELSPIASKNSSSGEEFNTNKTGPKIRKPIKPSTASTPNSKKGNFLSGLETPAETKRTIITRSSSALQSLRHGRKMLRNKESSSKSKAEVIDMIASAMNKANVEAKAGQRILTSLSNSKGRQRSDSLRDKAESFSKSPEFQEMPKMSKLLEKVAQHPESMPEQISSDDLESEVDDAPPVMADLDSVRGPLGILNRVDPSEPNTTIMNRLLRLSSIDTNAPPLKNLDNKLTSNTRAEGDKELGIRRNKSSGSLVEAMMANKIQTGFRPLGITGLVHNTVGGSVEHTSSSTGLLGIIGNNNKQDSSTAEEVSNVTLQTKETSKSVETGLDEAKKIDSATPVTGGFGFISSFLGKLS